MPCGCVTGGLACVCIYSLTPFHPSSPEISLESVVKEGGRGGRGEEEKGRMALHPTSFLFLHLSLHPPLHLFFLPSPEYQTEREREREESGWCEDELKGISEGERNVISTPLVIDRVKE